MDKKAKQIRFHEQLQLTIPILYHWLIILQTFTYYKFQIYSMKCFLIMPYGNLGDPNQKANWDALHELILEVTQSVIVPDGSRLECIRGDHELKPGEIVSGIVRDLAESSLAIAVLSGHNANVFYELGVRHALANCTILMAEQEGDVPFDLRTQRMLLFSTQSLAAGQRLKRQLRDTLHTIISQSSDEPDNPIQRYLASRAQKDLQPQDTIDQVGALREEMREMRNALSDLIVSNIGNSKRTDQPLATKSVLTSIQSVETSHHEKYEGRNELSNDHDSLEANFEPENFEGAWLNEETMTHAYAKMTKHGLQAIYCYGGDTHAVGLYEHFQVVGSRIFARFHWLHEPQIHGFTMLHIQGRDLLQGGWWYADTVSEYANGHIPELDEKHPEMIPSKWQKIAHKSFPEWAEDWFKQS